MLLNILSNLFFTKELQFIQFSLEILFWAWSFSLHSYQIVQLIHIFQLQLLKSELYPSWDCTKCQRNGSFHRSHRQYVLVLHCEMALPFEATQHSWLKFTLWTTITPRSSLIGLFVLMQLIISEVKYIAFINFFFQAIYLQLVNIILATKCIFSISCPLRKSYQDWTLLVTKYTEMQKLSDSERLFFKLSYESGSELPSK